MNRKHFIKTGITALAGMATGTMKGTAQVPGGSEPIPISIVKAFVSAGHNDLNKTKEMLAEIPALLHARYDWGAGDYESAIEGAGHVGNKEIANYLIEQGARVSLFQLTMLGKTALVKAVLEEYPALTYAVGPHGFTLLHHAKVGGADAEVLYDYLLEKGLKKTKIEIR